MTLKRLTLFLFLLVLLLSACSTVRTDDLTDWDPRDDKPQPYAVEDMRMPIAGTAAIYGLAYEGGFVSIPYDGDDARQVHFGEYPVGIAQSADGDPCFLTFEDLSAQLYVTCRMGPKKVLDPTDPPDAIEWWMAPRIELVRKIVADPKDWRDADFEQPFALMSEGDRLFVLTDRRLLSISKGGKKWQEIKIKKAIIPYLTEAQKGSTVTLRI